MYIFDERWEKMTLYPTLRQHFRITATRISSVLLSNSCWLLTMLGKHLYVPINEKKTDLIADRSLMLRLSEGMANYSVEQRSVLRFAR